MKITFIQPSKPKTGTASEKHWSLTRPLSLHFLASVVKNKTKFEYEIIDFESPKYNNFSYEQILKNCKSEIFGITSVTYTRFEAIKIIKLLKKLFPDCLIIAGGVHFMYVDIESLKDIPEIDIIVRGEGEIILENLLNAIYYNKSFDNIKGITYRNKNNQIIRNEDEIIFEDLDKIKPFFDFDITEYPEYLFGINEKINAISIMSSRGCPYNCIFCSKAGMKYRLRDPVNVISEIEYYINNFNIKAFNFLDLTFTVNNNHVKRICEEMINRKLNIKWWCESRANINFDLLKTMKLAGCESMVIGVESGSDRILKSISKNINKQDVINFAKICKELKITLGIYFMFSHPDETKNDVRETINFINQLREYTDYFSFQPSMILPGTKLEIIAKEKNILPKDFSWNQHYESKINKQLGQLSNIPLYIEKLKIKDLKKFLNLKINNDLKKYYSNNFNNILKKYTFTEFTKKLIKFIIKNKFNSFKILFSKQMLINILKKIFRIK